MVITQHHVAIFLSGLLIGCTVIAGAWFAAGRPSSASLAHRNSQVINTEPAGQDLQTVSICPLQAASAKSGEIDGQFPLQVDLAGLTVTEIASFIVIGKEAALSGRTRDAETAFLMSCRVADKFKGAASLESADAKYLLGGLYAKTAADPEFGAVANRAELLWRAQLLYSDSLNNFVKKLGNTDGKSLSATRELAAVQQSLARLQPSELSAATKSPVQEQSASLNKPDTAPPQGAAGVSSSNVKSRLQVPKNESAKASSATKSTTRAAELTGPSFNCAKAGSVPEKLICSDPELSQLDRELSRIYLQAKNATTDRAAFRRNQDREWLKRESTCLDRICLLGWYVERREQLMMDINGRSLTKAISARSVPNALLEE